MEIIESAGRAPSLMLYPGICLTTEGKARKNLRYRPKQVELIEIINKPLLLHLVGYLYYWQMGHNSVFKGLNADLFQTFFAPIKIQPQPSVSCA